MRNLIIILFCSILFGCSANGKKSDTSIVWTESFNNIDSIKPGIPAYKDLTIDYKRKGETIMTVHLKDPVVIGVAAKPEKWGFFQFPSIYRNANGDLIARWNMADDAVASYGNGGNGFAVSKDDGKTWGALENHENYGGVLLPDGDKIKIYTPKALKADTLDLPEPVGSAKVNPRRTFNYYKLNELPPDLRGVYIQRRAKGDTNWTLEHDALIDSQAVRYSDAGLFPVVWWGDMQVAEDGSVIAGIYPGFHLGKDGNVPPSGILFYRSTDNGHSWKFQGEIPYEPDLKSDPNGNQRVAMGFTEPAFEILSDGTFLCVMRTTGGLVVAGNSPMYYSYSKDMGVTWSTPEPFTPNGVLPRLLQLKNGVIVLSSGRPGVQLRFCMDGKGKKWTDPFEMLPYENEKDVVSCGYTGLIATGPNRFLLIYSDFKYHNMENEIRKAIKVREVVLTPKY